MKMLRLIAAAVPVLLLSSAVFAEERVLLEPDTPDGEIIFMHPGKVDPSRLPLDTVEYMHTTGSAPEINIRSWRLVLSRGDEQVHAFNYRQLRKMDPVRKKVLLICPGWFADYAEWEGVPLGTLLRSAGVGDDYEEIVFHADDGYRSSFNRDEVEENFLFLAYRLNGEDLPPEHGYPVRLVAEDVLGGRWVKWISRIELR